MDRVIFACVHNAGRSQMAAAFFNLAANPSRAYAVSAGTQPATQVHPEVQAAMAEVGLDLSGATPRKLTDALARAATVLVTLGCGEACPLVPGLRREDWPVPDPKGQPVEKVREIRDGLRTKVELLLTREGWNSAFTWRPAVPAELPAVERLLEENGLPTQGVRARFSDFVLVYRGSALVATAGLEHWGEAALLRSVAVAADERGQGLGQQLTARMVEAARQRGVRSLALLTTSAEPFFARAGFRRVAREALPVALHASVELQGACPASAVAMVRGLEHSA